MKRITSDFRWRVWAGFAFIPGMLWAQSMPVPVDVQFAVFSKILAFDRNLSKSGDEEIVIGVLYVGTAGDSRNVRYQVEQIVPYFPPVNELPVRFVFIDMDAGDWRVRARSEGVRILYVAPMPDPAMRTVIKFSREHRLLTMSGIVAFVDAGVSIGVAEQDGKPLPLINLQAAKSEGADFTSRLLQLSKVIHP